MLVGWIASEVLDLPDIRLIIVMLMADFIPSDRAVQR